MLKKDFVDAVTSLGGAGLQIAPGASTRGDDTKMTVYRSFEFLVGRSLMCGDTMDYHAG